MRVLVVEDDPKLLDSIRQGLKEHGFAVDVAPDGRLGLELALGADYDALVLDVMLPGKSGLDILRELRTRHRATPVLILSARSAVEDRVRGLDLGADDYISKPFSPRELVARVSAVLRRAQPPKAPDDVRRCGAVECDPSGRRVLADGVEVPLTATEFDLLAHLLASPGRVFTRTQLVRSVWGEDALLTLAGERTVDVHVAQLRAKLAPHEVIRTVRGVGYAARTDREHSPARMAGGSS